MAEIPPVIIQVKAELDEASLTELREKLRSSLATGQQIFLPPEPTPDQRRALIAAVRGSCACGSCKNYLAELIDSWGQIPMTTATCLSRTGRTD
jgi:hypothetical protein